MHSISKYYSKREERKMREIACDASHRDTTRHLYA